MSTLIDSIPCHVYGFMDDDGLDATLGIVSESDEDCPRLFLSLQGDRCIALTPEQVKMLKEALDTWDYGH